MRNLHWNPISPFDVEKTIWNDINDDGIHLEIESLESRFCWKDIERKTADISPTNSTKKSKKRL